MFKHINKNWPIYAWYFVIVIGLIITIAPFWWALSSSFKDNVTIFSEVSPFSFWSMVPGTSLDPYYGVFQKAKVGISVYDIRGQIVATLDERMLDPEKYSVSWNPHGNLPKGHYFVSIMINDLQVHYLKVIRQ